MTLYSILCRSWTYTLMNFGPYKSIKFTFALNTVHWTTWKSSIEIISSRTWSQSFVSGKTLFLWNGGVACSCCVWTFSWNEFTITAGRKHGWISANSANVVASVKFRSIGSTSCFIDESRSFLDSYVIICIGTRRLWPLPKPTSSNFLCHLYWLQRL